MAENELINDNIINNNNVNINNNNSKSDNNDITSDSSYFEGVEKLLEIWFAPNPINEFADLRKIPRYLFLYETMYMIFYFC